MLVASLLFRILPIVKGRRGKMERRREEKRRREKTEEGKRKDEKERERSMRRQEESQNVKCKCFFFKDFGPFWRPLGDILAAS